ncbi:LacI family DNA-binding transcriptional regulator [Natronosporangium hydrolyticum]|uniref:LacI family DNA-binding transcriptional regulator n=1 Tax=Natronosporangium hydrolyticum TaxID=2811111 RepID=A0A895YL21_9ACTN|nr:LacI family DNA-binding transcriptional regulator [Natronosporangium hydrolyticum]QSB14558.1 LacI family DNA-binding transcriptional regulator [Natronosporangium hydrolyticum]
MGYAENRGSYWRGRYKIGAGRYGTVCNAHGETIRFRTKREAKQAADAEEAKIRAGSWRDPAAGQVTFGAYASRWYAAQDLAASTMQNYRRHLEEHLLPEFGDRPLVSILSADVEAWEKRERKVYAAASVKTWRSTLHLVLADALEEGLIGANPATKRRGRGKRAGRSRNRGPEKTVTTALGVLLIAERAALLSGRDDEFVALLLKGFTGIRWGELVGLETEFIRPGAVRVEWQLYELDTGELVRCPPKDDSYRTIDLPGWLADLVAQHLARTRPKPCACHGKTYVFQGRGSSGQLGATLVDVARRAEVSTGTVSNVLNRPAVVAERTRVRVEAAIADLGFARHRLRAEPVPHWRRTGFATWLFGPAASGWYPKKAPQEARPVPVLAEPWPGVPARGRNASGRADACWLPIAAGLTPHGLRHSHRTHLEELRTERVLMDDRMGHTDGSIGARYAHVTPTMRRRLLAGLDRMWREALTTRREMSPRSPVAALDALLRSE